MRIGFVISFFLISLSPMAQQASQQIEADSLLALIRSRPDDTVKVNLLLKLPPLSLAVTPEKALYYTLQARGLAEALHFTNGRIEAIGELGAQEERRLNMDKAMMYYDTGVALAEKENNHYQMLQYYQRINNICFYKGNYPKAMETSLKGLKLGEKTHNKTVIASFCNLVGVINDRQNNFQQARIYYSRYLEIAKELGNPGMLANAYNNMANIIFREGNTKLTLEYYFNVLKLFEQLKNPAQIAFTYNNLSSTFKATGDIKRALEFSEKCLAITAKVPANEFELANYYLNNGELHSLLGDENKAEAAFKKALAIATRISHQEDIKMAYFDLSELYRKKGSYKQAYDYYVLYSTAKDSLLSAYKSKQIAELGTQYETEKKELQIASLNKDKLLKEKELEKKNAQVKEEKLRRNSFVLGFVLVLILVIVVYGRYRQKQRDNVLLVEKNLLIEHQKREITDSINYAKRIQSSILPPVPSITAAFPDTFVLFKPKDVISGDFYWFDRSGNKLFIAAADCTGHGVPGALMSMVGTEKLNEALAQHGEPDLILRSVNRSIKKALRQSGQEDASRDGMDIALCCFTTGMDRAEYAGANRPLWIIKKGAQELTEIKATKVAIGGFTEDEQVFQQHSIALQKGDTLYMCSDGYGDQFNEKDKKLMTKKFKEILLSVQHLSMAEQRNYLDEFIESWKGASEQTDDILVIGIRV